MSTHLIGYPRSGNNWIQNRLALFQWKCLHDYTNMPQIVIDCNISHLGYGIGSAEAVFNSSSEYYRISNGDTVFCILRDAKAILCSYFFYMKKFPDLTADVPDCPESLDELVTSPWGVERFCRFTNQINELKQRVILAPLYYRDMFKKTFIKRLPQLIGSNYILNQREIDWIYDNSDVKKLRKGIIDDNIPTDPKNSLLNVSHQGGFRKGQIDDYKNYLSLELQEYIDNFMTQYCLLPEYRDVYL